MTTCRTWHPRWLSPAERHTNSNCLECLAHGRACLWGSGWNKRAAAAQRLLFVFGVCTTIRPNTNILFSLLFGPNRIRIEYSVQPYRILILIPGKQFAPKILRRYTLQQKVSVQTMGDTQICTSLDHYNYTACRIYFHAQWAAKTRRTYHVTQGTTLQLDTHVIHRHHQYKQWPTSLFDFAFHQNFV